MEVPEALRDCAQLLTIAAKALKRISESEAKKAHSPQVAAQLDEVLAIADRLDEIGQSMGRPSD